MTVLLKFQFLRVNLVNYLSGNVHIFGSANVKLNVFINSDTEERYFLQLVLASHFFKYTSLRI